MCVIKKPSPFIKWVGGKRQLLPELKKRLPNGTNKYFEPFIGGGALLWEMDRSVYHDITISDYNFELINTYKMVKENPLELIAKLSKYKNTEDEFYRIRHLDRESNYDSLSPLEKACRFIYLNKTCFNGLYRVNSKNQFNAPYGKSEKTNIFDIDNIKLCSDFLQGINISSGDFSSIQTDIDERSFVYLDPPYIPLDGNANFVGYTDKGFGEEHNRRLKEFCDHVHRVGGKFMMSNSSASVIYDLYSDYEIEDVLAKRSINSKGDGRGKINEVIIRNY